MVHQHVEGGGHGGLAVLDEKGRGIVERRTFVVVGRRESLPGEVQRPRKP
ncbi:MAG: hypothetical protein ACKOTB_04605 [Planctomycetia bacterium]